MRPALVLIVEDNPADIELIREALSLCSFSYSIEVASDFELAKTRIETIATGVPCPDVILLDLNLPMGSGMDLLKLLRAQSSSRLVPVIIVSSSNAPRDRQLAAQLGVTHYFRKPTDLDEFMTLGPLVESVLGQSATGAGVAQ